MGVCSIWLLLVKPEISHAGPVTLVSSALLGQLSHLARAVGMSHAGHPDVVHDAAKVHLAELQGGVQSASSERGNRAVHGAIRQQELRVCFSCENGKNIIASTIMNHQKSWQLLSCFAATTRFSGVTPHANIAFDELFTEAPTFHVRTQPQNLWCIKPGPTR